MPDPCAVAIRGHIATVTMNRDDRRNAFDAATLLALKETFSGIVAGGAARVVIVTGVGNTFSAGADLSPLKGITDPAERRRLFAPHGARIAELLAETARVLLAPEIVTIAAINGHAIGGGWLLALVCDFQIASDHARFWFPEIELGRAVTTLTCQMVTAQAGPILAREILMTARRYTAHDLLQRGLVHEVVPADGVADAATALSTRLANLDPTALSILKQRINGIAFAG